MEQSVLRAVCGPFAAISSGNGRPELNRRHLTIDASAGQVRRSISWVAVSAAIHRRQVAVATVIACPHAGHEAERNRFAADE